jgi:hypothetical protein
MDVSIRHYCYQWSDGQLSISLAQHNHLHFSRKVTRRICFCRTSGFHIGGYKSFLSCALLANFFMLISCVSFSSTLKIEVTCSSETLVDFQQTIRHYTPEDITLLICFCLFTALFCNARVFSVDKIVSKLTL